MEIIRLKSSNLENLYEYIKNKKCIIVLNLETENNNHIITDQEFALLNYIEIMKKSYELSDFFRLKGKKVKIFDLEELGINTNKNYIDALVESIDAYYYKKYLSYNDYLIIPGGVGTYFNKATYLGKLGADLTSIALGIRLELPISYFYNNGEIEIVDDLDFEINNKAKMLIKNNSCRLKIIGRNKNV